VSGASILAFALVFGIVFIGGKLASRRVGARVRKSVVGPIDRFLGGGFGALKGLIGATLLYLTLNLVYDTIWGRAAERPEWMAQSRTYPLLHASGEAIVLAAWWMGAPGATRGIAVMMAVAGAAYVALRLLGGGHWAPFEQAIGLGFTEIEPPEAIARFGAFPYGVYAYNGIANRNDQLVREMVLVSTTVGREGQMTDRASVGSSTGGWAAQVEAVNSLITDLMQPTTEVARVLTAVARGDLSQKMVL
jgi:hypothetical protein